MNKQLKWLEHYGASSAKLAQHVDMTPEAAEKIHQRFLDQWHKDAKVRESLFFKRLPEAKDSFQKMTPEFWASRLEPPYAETMKPKSIWDEPDTLGGIELPSLGLPRKGIYKNQNVGTSVFKSPRETANLLFDETDKIYWYTGQNPLAITAVAKAVGTLAIDLVKHKRMGR